MNDTLSLEPSSRHASGQLIFLTSFRYPTQYAHPVWGLQMARAWTSLLGNSFVFAISDTRSPALLNGVSYVCAFPRAAKLLQKLHLRTIAYSVWFPMFLLRRRCFGDRNVVFVNDPQLAKIVIVYKYLFRYRFVFECHGEYTPRMRRFLYANADRIIFISRRLQEYAIKETSAYAAKSKVILNGVDVERFVYGTQSAASIREQLGITDDGIFIGYMGRFRPGDVDKGVSFMVRALAQLSGQYRMLFVGGIDTEIQEMEALARSVGVSDRIIFRSFIPTDEVPKYASACDILCYVPETISFQQRETLPMKLFEYMAARRPIIVSDTPSVREMLDESCAHFCEAGSVESFVDAVARAVAAPSTFTERAYVRVGQHTWLSRAKQMSDFSRS